MTSGNWPPKLLGTPTTDKDPRVQADFDELAGKVVLLKAVDAYRKDTDRQVMVSLSPPVAFIVNKDSQCLHRRCDDWLDPIYDVDPVDPSDPQVAGYRSFYCYGRSYHVHTGEIEDGDVQAVQQPDGTWKPVRGPHV